MKRRILCFVLAFAMVLGSFATESPRVHAAENLKTSEAGIQLIKDFEGFTKMAVYDYLQYSIGYGSACEKDEYPNGITEEEADRLLREDLLKRESYLDSFVTKYGLNLSQRQYDALMSFTYNLGYGWMYEESTLRSTIIQGKTGNDLIFALTMWCNAGGVVNNGLVQRRLAEANLYLNGVYSKTPPSNYRYILFDNNMEEVTDTVKIQGYDITQPEPLRASPSKEGYRFLGWYTQASGGAWITEANESTSGVTLYGHWQAEGTTYSDPVAAGYTRIAAAGQILYDAPGGKQKSTYQGGEKLTVTADYMDDDGVKWGRVSTGGWIKLAQTEEGDSQPDDQKVNLNLTVTGEGVNIRSGPGTSYEVVGVANKGDKLTVTKVQQGGNYLWGYFTKGWICLDYTDYEQVIRGEQLENVNITGEVGGIDQLEIRSEPRMDKAVIGSYYRGDVMKITQLKTVGITTWGKTAKGWINMHYIRQLTSPIEGVVIECTGLSVRSGPGTAYERLEVLNSGDKVTILEIETVNGSKWGRISKGWVSMDYIRMNVEGALEPDEDRMHYIEVTTSLPEGGKTVTVTGDLLRIRSGAGLSYPILGGYLRGTQVVILEQKLVGATVWGRTDKGWISMDYVK